jgi:tRNA pseudouridine55 synthase
MKGGILNLYKKRGETPLERIKRFKIENPGYDSVKMSYAGRLDPMAEGVLLILVGEENKKREHYLGYKKDYIFDILFGVRTDTYDALGKVHMEDEIPYGWEELDELVRDELGTLKGKIMQKYPPFSSKPVKGPNGEAQKPLFEWAKEGKTELLDLPETEVEIFEIAPILTYTLPRDILSKHIFETIIRVNGDFRQKAIFESWIAFFEKSQRECFNLMRVKISCSSGTYVRGIVNNLGKKIGVPALAFKIVRTKIGDYRLEDSV